MDEVSQLTLCREAIDAAERFPGRHDEYKGNILATLAKLYRKLLTKGRLSSKDERVFAEIILLTEKWVE